MLWIISGVISGIIWFSLFREVRFRAKCRNLYNTRRWHSNNSFKKELRDNFNLCNHAYHNLVISYKRQKLMCLYLHNGEFWSEVKNKKLRKFCKKELKTYVLDEYAKLKHEEKLEKQKKKEFELKIVNDGFK